MNIGLNIGIGSMGGGGAALLLLFWLRNVLSLVATVGASSTFSRGLSTITVPAWDATLGSILITTASDAIASPYMRHDAGTWHNDDGSGNSLHPTNDQGVFILHPSWIDAEVVAAGSSRVDFVGNQAKYYFTVAGGTTSGTGIADDTGVTWVLQGNYTNEGGGKLPGLVSETATTELAWPSNNFTGGNYIKSETTIDPSVVTGPDGVANSGSKIVETAVNSTHSLRFGTTSVGTDAIFAPILKSEGRTWVGLQITSSLAADPFIFFDLQNKVFGSGTAAVGTFGYINHGDGWVQPWLKVPGIGTSITALLFLADSDGGSTYLGDITKGVFIFHMSMQIASNISSPIYTTTGTVQRNASTEANPHIITAQFIRYRVTRTITGTHLSDGTNAFDYDEDITTLTFTDGVTTLSTVVTLAIGDAVVLDQGTGTLWVEGVAGTPNGALDPSWSAITDIGNITDLQDSTDIDPTDVFWDK